jgi:hypothetical protein
MELKPLLITQFKALPSGRIYNERLMEEWEKQQKRKLAGGMGGAQKVANRVAKGVAKGVANRVAALEDENEIENGSDHYPEIPTLAEAIAQTMTSMIPEDFCAYVYSKWAERQGKDGANVPVKWLDHVKGRWIREQVQWKNGTHHGNPTPNGKPIAPEKKVVNPDVFEMAGQRWTRASGGPKRQQFPDGEDGDRDFTSWRNVYDQWLSTSNK